MIELKGNLLLNNLTEYKENQILEELKNAYPKYTKWNDEDTTLEQFLWNIASGSVNQNTGTLKIYYMCWDQHSPEKFIEIISKYASEDSYLYGSNDNGYKWKLTFKGGSFTDVACKEFYSDIEIVEYLIANNPKFSKELELLKTALELKEAVV